MFRNMVISAAGAGLAVCLVVALLQAFTTGPLILHAEVYEKADAVAPPGQGATPGPHASGGAPLMTWEPAGGIERTFYTALADLVVGIAISLMVLGAMIAKGDPVNARRGLMWGVAGFAAASLLPSLGLPPELPGTPSGDLLSRQIWWVAAAAASGLGLFAIAFARHWAIRVAGIGLLLLPHLIGAPAPPSQEAAYPAALAGEFVAASILVSAVLWSLSGLASGWLYARLAQSG